MLRKIAPLEIKPRGGTTEQLLYLTEIESWDLFQRLMVLLDVYCADELKNEFYINYTAVTMLVAAMK